MTHINHIPTKRTAPLPLFDAIEYMDWDKKYSCSGFPYVSREFQYALDFLFCYKDNKETFNAYRREIERFLSWCWFIAHSPLLKIKRFEFEEYLEFCQSPPLAWIGIKKAPRFIEEQGIRIPNRQWRPFVATVSKTAYRKGESPDKYNYLLSQKALQAIFATISSFYNFLIQNEITEINPVVQIR
jgi:site-specific recombinase XerD